MEFRNILLSVENEIATLTINRPKALNALNIETLQEIQKGIEEVRDRREMKVLILTGAGDKAFVAGADILEMKGMNSLEAFNFSRMGHLIMKMIQDFDRPVIAAVNGFALGGGMEIALACDIRILSERATLQLPEAGRGLIPGWGGTQRLPRLVSPAKAAEMIFLGVPMAAEEAYRLGLVNKVVAPDQLLPTAVEWATKICEKGPLAIRRAKEAMVRGRDMTLEDGLRLELAFFEEMLHSEEYQEGLRSLAEGRKPKYPKG